MTDASPPLIRTPDQRLRVFVSSTLAELADERRTVARVITALGLAPVMFELGARPHPPQELYRAYLAQSDVFIGLYWESYGWVGPGMDISGLEDEYRLSGGRPRLLYLKSPAPRREERLEAMIQQLRDEGAVAYRSFRSARELARLVRDDLALLLSERFMTSTAAAPPAPTRATRDRAELAAAITRRTLPVPSTSLIGREAEVAEIAAQLADEDVRLVTITGPGGMGKTRVAIAVGERLAAKPVVFVSLESTTDPDDLLPRIAAAADVIIEGTRSTADILADAFAAAPPILVLDNLEQIVTAAATLDLLISRCPGLRMLATSRVALRLRAEHEYVLGPLAGDVSDEAPAGHEHPAAVRLFLDRAAAAGRTVDTSPESLAAVTEICRRLDGLPLAIELAAARTRLLTPAAVLSRLGTVLDALGSGPVDLPARQRTLRTTVEWSVGLLGEDERAALGALAVFVDGWTVETAAAVWARDEATTLDRLDTLIGHSLVSTDLGGVEPRFRMLTAVREYSGGLLDRASRDEAERRHAAAFADLAEQDVDAGERVRWAERLRADDENVRAAIRWFFDYDISRLPHLFRCLWLSWQVDDHMAEARVLINELAQRVSHDDLGPQATAEMLFLRAVLAADVGDDEEARDVLDALQATAATVDDADLRDAMQLAAAWTLGLRDDFDGALRAAASAYVGLAERQGVLQGSAALTLGMLRMAGGDRDAARTHLAEADAFGARLGIEWISAAAAAHLTILDVQSGDPVAARDRLRALVSGMDPSRTATLPATLLLASFGEWCASTGRYAAAAEAIGAIDGIRRHVGFRPWPNSRAHEADLRRRVREALTAVEWDAAYSAASATRAADAVALVRTGLAG